MCILMTTSISVNDADRVTTFVVQRARTAKQTSIGILFLSSSTPNVFQYRDVFTKYIDVGIRIYVENSIEMMKKIILKNCKSIYVSVNDAHIQSLLDEIDLPIHKI